MKTSLLICSVVLSSVQILAQPVLVNADGTHSSIVDNGPTSTVINSNGRYSVIFNNGPTSTMVNADGSHSTISNNGLTSVVVGGNGGHSVMIESHQTENTPNPEEISDSEDGYSTAVDQVSKTPRHKHHPKNKGYKKHKTPKKHKKR
ncbi:MAG TPA: hypothetical protein VK666_29510 [Chryseolinea sp.]|nr:hypothetical protein [Chryseolinea sp.]